MTNIPALPLNIDPRIAEILRKRAEQGITITKTAQPRLRTQALPDTTDPVPAPSVPPVVTPVGDAELAALLDGALPRIDQLIERQSATSAVMENSP